MLNYIEYKDSIVHYSQEYPISKNPAISGSVFSQFRILVLKILYQIDHSYLQVLRVAMIELINDDYADFVNLSSNLVCIDVKIIAIEKPLIEFKGQILNFQKKLDSTQKQLEAKLAQRKALHDQRVALRNLEHIINLLNKVERLLGLHEGSEDQDGDSQVTMVVMLF